MRRNRKTPCTIFDIQSKLIHQLIGSYLPKTQLLRIAKYSKKLQHLMNLSKEEYEIYSLPYTTNKEEIISFQTTIYDSSIKKIQAINEFSNSSILNSDHAEMTLPVTVFSLTQLNNGKIIAGSQTAIHIINPVTYEIEKEIEIKCQGAIVNIIQIKDNIILCGPYINYLKIIDINTEQTLNELNGSNPLLLNNDKLAYIYDIKEIRIISTNSYLELMSIEIDKIHKSDQDIPNVIGSMIQLNNNDLLISSWNKAISQYDIQTKVCVKKIKTDIEFIHFLLPLKDERIIMTAVDVAHIYILDLFHTEHIMTIKGHNKTVNDVIQLEDETLVSASDDKKIKFWRKKDKTFECTLTFYIFKDYIRKLIRLNDGRLCGISDEQIFRITGLNDYVDNIYIKFIPTLNNNEEDNANKAPNVFEIYDNKYDN